MIQDRLCTACMRGRLMDLGEMSVCSWCRVVVLPPTPPVPTLDELLAFAERYPDAPTTTIRRELEVSALRYHQLLNRAIDTDEAHDKAPVLVARLRARRRLRAVMRTGAA